MRISIGAKPKDGPWGGGNQFVKALTRYLTKHNADVCFDLKSPPIDIILLFDPRKESASASFQAREIFAYLKKQSDTIVVHRVNECDERKNTKGVKRRIAIGNYCADHTVFVSSWLQNLYYEKMNLPCVSQSVILNGSDRTIFNRNRRTCWKRDTPFKVVTHHWGTNWNKGFEMYSLLDEMIGSELKGKVEFTYIGNLPKGFQFYHSNYIRPLHGAELAAKLKEHDAYITASKNEPGPNHQNEGALCGLPVLYLDSGPMAEYCKGYGLPITEESLSDQLYLLMDNYSALYDRMSDYPHHGDAMCDDYYQLFKSLLANKRKTIAHRKSNRFYAWKIKSLIYRN